MQFLNAFTPICVTLIGIVKALNEQFSNALSPIIFKLSIGLSCLNTRVILIDTKVVQFSNALLRILVTLFGIIIFLIQVFLNAESPIIFKRLFKST